MQTLSGRETFEFYGNEKPKSMLVYSLKYNFPNHNVADCYLLSISVNTFYELANFGRYPSLGTMLAGKMLGKLHIEFGGTLSSKSIIFQPI